MQGKRAPSYLTVDDDFPSNLRKCMEEHGVTQAQLASILGVSRSAVGFYTQGNTKPKLEAAITIARYFNVSLDWLLGLSKTKTSNPDVREVCDFTGLSDDAVLMLNSAKDDRSVSGYESYILENPITPQQIRESISTLLSSPAFFSFSASLANLKNCIDSAGNTIQQIQTGDHHFNVSEKRKLLTDTKKMLEISMYELNENTRNIAETEYYYSSIMFQINTLMGNLPLFDTETEGGAHDAENSPES